MRQGGRQYLGLEINRMRINCPGLGLDTKSGLHRRSTAGLRPDAQTRTSGPTRATRTLDANRRQRRAIPSSGSDFDPVMSPAAKAI